MSIYFVFLLIFSLFSSLGKSFCFVFALKIKKNGKEISMLKNKRQIIYPNSIMPTFVYNYTKFYHKVNAKK